MNSVDSYGGARHAVLVNRIDVVRNQRRAQNFPMTLIRITGSQLHAARVLVGLSRESLAERAGLLCRAGEAWREGDAANHGGDPYRNDHRRI